MPIAGECVTKKGTSLSVEYPRLKKTVRYMPDRMGWRGCVTALFDMVLDLSNDAKSADLDLAVHLDMQERRIDTFVKTVNKNFTTHRELIEGQSEVFATQATELAELRGIIEAQGRTIEVLKNLLRVDTDEPS